MESTLTTAARYAKPTVPTAIVLIIILTMILKHLFPNEKPLLKELYLTLKEQLLT